MAQQALRRHQHQRLSERQGDLSAEDVIVVRGRRAVGDDPVDVVKLSDGELFAFRWEIIGIVG